MNTTLPQITNKLKDTIITAQYNAVKIINSVQVRLYFEVGKILASEIKKANWGDKVLETISNNLQQEINGLRGFSAQNLKKMKLFYETYADLQIGSAMMNQLENEPIKKGSALPNQLEKHFWNIGFTAHILILTKTKTLEERVFYIIKTVENNWVTRVLENHLNNKLHLKQAKLTANFKETTPLNYKQVNEQFRTEYLLDFVSIHDVENEKKVENAIVNNIRNFILNLGTGFSFIGNQYRLMVDQEEYFIDLLFYNRNLQALVAIELKRGKFTPKDAGQLNFYLNVLDDTVKLPNENPSIGIILCREKNNTTVEYALRNLNKPMGVATYLTKEEIPEKYKNILPSANELIKLLEK